MSPHVARWMQVTIVYMQSSIGYPTSLDSSIDRGEHIDSERWIPALRYSRDRLPPLPWLTICLTAETRSALFRTIESSVSILRCLRVSRPRWRIFPPARRDPLFSGTATSHIVLVQRASALCVFLCVSNLCDSNDDWNTPHRFKSCTIDQKSAAVVSAHDRIFR